MRCGKEQRRSKRSSGRGAKRKPVKNKSYQKDRRHPGLVRRKTNARTNTSRDRALVPEVRSMAHLRRRCEPARRRATVQKLAFVAAFRGGGGAMLQVAQRAPGRYPGGRREKMRTGNGTFAAPACPLGTALRRFPSRCALGAVSFGPKGKTKRLYAELPVDFPWKAFTTSEMNAPMDDMPGQDRVETGTPECRRPCQCLKRRNTPIF